MNGSKLCVECQSTWTENIIIEAITMYDEEEILLDYIRSEKYENSKEIAVKMLKEGNLSVEQLNIKKKKCQ